jgi:hypothetical protein
MRIIPLEPKEFTVIGLNFKRRVMKFLARPMLFLLFSDSSSPVRPCPKTEFGAFLCSTRVLYFVYNSQMYHDTNIPFLGVI